MGPIVAAQAGVRGANSHAVAAAVDAAEAQQAETAGKIDIGLIDLVAAALALELDRAADNQAVRQFAADFEVHFVAHEGDFRGCIVGVVSRAKPEIFTVTAAKLQVYRRLFRQHGTGGEPHSRQDRRTV